MPLQGFLDLGLNPSLLRGLEAMGFEEPTPVQVQTVPPLLAGRDVIVQAQTGSGKTAAYGIPIAQWGESQKRSIQALVLSPTRELALQVAEALNTIAKYCGLNAVPVYGGQAYGHQKGALKGAHIVVATPGRLLDLLEQRALNLGAVKLVVIDEADEMLAMGFIEDVEKILQATPATRQTALFSATMRREIVRLAAKYMKSPEQITLSQPRALTVPTVTQSHYMLPRPYKTEALLRLLDVLAPKLALVFCATRMMTAELAANLKVHGYRTEALHGDMTQAQREVVMSAARKGRYEVLVATDVAARGLDVPEVSHVFNFDIPTEPDRYVHRIGRTARMGRAGEAITLIAPQEQGLLRMIENATGSKVPRKELPSVAEMEQRDRARMLGKVEEVLAGDKWTEYRALVNELALTRDPLDLAAAGLALAAGPARKRQEIPKGGAPRPPGFRPGSGGPKFTPKGGPRGESSYDPRERAGFGRPGGGRASGPFKPRYVPKGRRSER